MSGGGGGGGIPLYGLYRTCHRIGYGFWFFPEQGNYNAK